MAMNTAVELINLKKIDNAIAAEIKAPEILQVGDSVTYG